MTEDRLPDAEVWASLARDYAATLDAALDASAARVQIGPPLDHPLDPTPVTPWRPTRRQRLAWWWQGVRERLGEIVAGRRFDEGEG